MYVYIDVFIPLAVFCLFVTFPPTVASEKDTNFLTTSCICDRFDGGMSERAVSVSSQWSVHCCTVQMWRPLSMWWRWHFRRTRLC